jgi:hypothetical protein
LTNFGNTPAHLLRFTSCEPIIRNDQDVPDIHCNVTTGPSQPAELGPKQFTHYAGEVIKEDDLEATKDGKRAVYVLGYVTYQDSIDVDANNLPEQRVTRFCLRVIQTKTATNVAVPNFLTGAPLYEQGCPSFSCMDEMCRPLPK